VASSRPVKMTQTVESALLSAEKRMLNAFETLHNAKTQETWWVVETENTTQGQLWEMYERMEPTGFLSFFCFQFVRNLDFAAGLCLPGTWPSSTNTHTRASESPFCVAPSLATYTGGPLNYARGIP